MVDDQHLRPGAGMDAQDQVAQGLRFRHRQPACRFIEHDQAGAAHHATRHVGQAAFEPGQVGPQLARPVSQTDDGQHVQRLGPAGATAGQLPIGLHQHVIQHGQIIGNLFRLKRPAQALLRPAMRGQAQNVGAIQQRLAAAGGQKP